MEEATRHSQHGGLALLLCSLSLGLTLPVSAACRVAGGPVVQGQLVTALDNYQSGLVALRDGRIDLAVQYLTKAEREHPADATIRNFRGIALARLHRNREAEAEYREAIRLDPALEAAYRNLGFLAWNSQQWSVAEDAFRKALSLSPNDGFARHYLGRVELETGAYADGFAELQSSGLPTPEDPEYLAAAAAGYLALGKQAKAKQTVDRLAGQKLDEAQQVHLASLFLSVRENVKAVQLLQALDRRQWGGAKPWIEYDLSLIYLWNGDFQQAVKQAESSAKGYSQNAAAEMKVLRAQAWTVDGIAKARLGDGAGGLDAFRGAVQLDPLPEEYWLNLTRELMEKHGYAEAVDAAAEGVVSHPRSYALQLRLGAANLSAARYPEAERIFRALIAAGDPLATSSVGLAQVLLRVGRADEAAAVLAEARQRLGESFLLSYFEGLALDRAGKRTEAIASFQAAVRQNPSSAEARFGAGKTELAAGRIQEAIADLEEAKRLGPHDVQTQRLLSQAYHRVGDSRIAETASEEPAAEPATNLLGDFFVPAWKEAPPGTASMQPR